jgi:hypothetical protein
LNKLLRLLLAISLLFAQAGALQHALSHTQEDEQPASHAPHFKACVKCLAYAETCAGPKSTHVLLLCEGSYVSPHTDAPQSASSCLLVGYSPRAPPIPSSSFQSIASL